MLEALSKTTISEVVLLFLLLFVLPLVLLLLRRLRKYEALFGVLPEEGRKKKGKKKEAPVPEAPPAPVDPVVEAPPDDRYPYASRQFLSRADMACLTALRESFGPEVEVFAKVALWELVESTDKAPGYAGRLKGLDFDYLLCDRTTGRMLTAVMYNPGKGRPAGPVDEVRKICAAAEVNVVFIDMAEKYDAKTLGAALGLSALDG